MNNTDRTPAPTTITLLTNERGDFEAHVGGCSDIRKASRRYPDRVTHCGGTDLVAAIIDLDTEAAAWFGCEPYTEKAREDGCWAIVNGIESSPCLVKAIKAAGITFDSDGRPS
jgi:hypothetical protein